MDIDEDDEIELGAAMEIDVAPDDEGEPYMVDLFPFAKPIKYYEICYRQFATAMRHAVVPFQHCCRPSSATNAASLTPQTYPGQLSKGGKCEGCT